RRRSLRLWGRCLRRILLRPILPPAENSGPLDKTHWGKCYRQFANFMISTIESSSLPWEERFNEKIGANLYRKNLFTDPETGMEIRLVRYPAGIVNPRHT